MAKKKKSKLTTKPIYKNGYEAAQANEPRVAPHRIGTTSEEIWLAGYNAYVSGGAMPEEPRKKRTKAEMEEAKTAPPKSVLPAYMKPKFERPRYTPSKSTGKPGKLSLRDEIYAVEGKMFGVTDSEVLEIMHMELADLKWLMWAGRGDKPSDVWEAYKKEHGLDFEGAAA